MPDTDRELLQAAARAVGMSTTQWAEPGELLPDKGGWVQFIGFKRVSIFNALTDDGDALRLAVKIGMNVACVAGHWTVVAAGFFDDSGDPAVELKEPHGTDPMAATRRAITRAAASMAPTAGASMADGER